MKYLLILLLLIFPFGQLIRFNIGSGVTLQLNDLAAGIVFLFSLPKINKNPLKKPILIWFVVMGLSLLINVNNFSPTQLLVSSLYAVRWIAYAGIFFYFYGFEDKKLIKKGLILASFAVAIAGVAQYLLIPNVSFMSADNWDNHYFRLVSSFFDPGFTGAVLGLGLILAYNFGTPISNLFSMVQYSTIYTALLLTYSRASYLLYFVGFTLIAFYKRSIKLFLVVVIIFAVSLPLLPKTYGEGTKLARESSVWSRLENWALAVSVWQKYPVFGSGYDSFRYASGASAQSHAGAGSDSSLLLILATTGIVGLLAYLNLLKSMWDFGSKNMVFKVSLVAVLVHSWFNNTLLYPWIMEWLWLLLVL